MKLLLCMPRQRLGLRQSSGAFKRGETLAEPDKAHRHQAPPRHTTPE